MTVCDGSSQDAFYCSSGKVDKDLAQEFSPPKLGRDEVEPFFCTFLTVLLSDSIKGT